MFQLRWLWKNLKGNRVKYVFALISSVLLASSMMIQNLIISEIMDKVFYPLEENPVVTQDIVSLLVSLVIFLVAFTFLRTSIFYLSVITYEQCSQRMVYKLRNELYVNMQHMDMSFYSKNRTGDLMTRLTGDMDMIRQTVSGTFRMIIDCVVLFFTTMVIFFMKDALFALCMLAVTPFIFLATYFFSKKVGPMFRNLREKLSQLNTCAQENISGNRVVKAFAKEEYECEKFDQKNKDFRDANLKTTMTWLSFMPYIDLLSQSVSVAVLLIGGIFLINGRITIGTFTLFNSLSWTVTNPMRNIGMLINDFQRFFASATKIIELYYARTTIITKDDAVKKDERIKGQIDFENVTLNLNHTDVLKDINLSIKPNETVAIMGPTGCGKTSLINLIPRFVDVTKGKISVDGVPVPNLDLKYLRSGIGIATQDVFLFSDTVDGNIAYGDTSLTEDEVKEYARIADVDFAESLPQGFDTVIGERGTGLSGGQKQRIALARALAVRPSILILDDTTSAVDLETEKYIQHELKNLDFDCTKIIIAQRISTTKSADKIVIMDKGKIVQVGTHEELIKQEGYYREVYLLQNGEEDVTAERGA